MAELPQPNQPNQSVTSGGSMVEFACPKCGEPCGKAAYGTQVMCPKCKSKCLPKEYIDFSKVQQVSTTPLWRRWLLGEGKRGNQNICFVDGKIITKEHKSSYPFLCKDCLKDISKRRMIGGKKKPKRLSNNEMWDYLS